MNIKNSKLLQLKFELDSEQVKKSNQRANYSNLADFRISMHVIITILGVKCGPELSENLNTRPPMQKKKKILTMPIFIC